MTFQVHPWIKLVRNLEKKTGDEPRIIDTNVKNEGIGYSVLQNV